MGLWGEGVRKGVEVEGWSFVEEEREVMVMEVDGGDDMQDEELKAVVL